MGKRFQINILKRYFLSHDGRIVTHCQLKMEATQTYIHSKMNKGNVVQTPNGISTLRGRNLGTYYKKDDLHAK